MEESERQRIESIKDNERKKATQEIENFKKIHKKIQIENEPIVPVSKANFFFLIKTLYK